MFSLAAALAFAAWGGMQGWLRGGHRIDEAHKISEAAFLRLALAGDAESPFWTQNRVDRFNPPIGKFLFAAAILAAGEELPRLPTLSLLAPDNGLMPGLPPPPPGQSQLLLPCRILAFSATSVAVFLAMLLLFESGHAIAALLALLLFATNFVTATHGGSAIFDPLLLVFAQATIVALVYWLGKPDRPRRLLLALIAAALVAFATQIRLSAGLLAVLTMAVFVLGAIREKRAATLESAAVFAPAYILLSVAMNPYYWAGVKSVGSFIPTVVARVGLQLEDGGVLMAALRRSGGTFASKAEKWSFVSETLFGDFSGILLLVTLVAGIASVARYGRDLDRLTGDIIIVHLLAAVLFVMWLPLPWPRYLLVPLLPLTVAAVAASTPLLHIVRQRMMEAVTASRRAIER